LRIDEGRTAQGGRLKAVEDKIFSLRPEPLDSDYWLLNSLFLLPDT
jgi:hypothetical protein